MTPKIPGWGRQARTHSVAIVVALGLGSFWYIGHKPDPFGTNSSNSDLATVEVDQGDVALVVTEDGSLESSDDDVIRCRIESFLASPAGASSANSGARAPQARRPSTTMSTATSTAESKSAVIALDLKTKLRALSQVDASQGVAKSGTARAGGMSKADGKSKATDSSTGKYPSNTATTVDSSNGESRPVIRSFDYVVEPHIPLRSQLANQGAIASAAAPPPTILSILPEGTHVKAGDVVCEIDSSAFREARQIQQLRDAQSKAWVEQARYILEAGQIAHREYAEGILPQDIELVRQYISICETKRDQGARNLAWARSALAKGYRTSSQVDADAAAFQQTEIALRDAEGMLERLVKFTGKRILKASLAKLAAIRADLLSLESSFQLESERLRRIEAIIANCTMQAPRDGIVVHANRSNGWGRLDNQIREGMIVYQSQPIFRLLDPKHMQVRAMINESQVALLRSGQPVLIHLEAFPDRALRGSVAEIVPIPGLTNGPFSDVHTFYATVHIDSGSFDELRTGLSAELEFLVETRHRVTRVPLEAIRWVGDRSFAAMAVDTVTGPNWEWKPVELGATDTEFAEVISGLEPGDRVIAHSERLPTIELGPQEPEAHVDIALGSR